MNIHCEIKPVFLSFLVYEIVIVCVYVCICMYACSSRKDA
jgi:hypothetical protein